MFLTSPLIEQAIARFDRLSLSATGILDKYEDRFETGLSSHSLK